jgi:hypothetical protein
VRCGAVRCGAVRCGAVRGIVKSGQDHRTSGWLAISSASTAGVQRTARPLKAWRYSLMICKKPITKESPTIIATGSERRWRGGGGGAQLQTPQPPLCIPGQTAAASDPGTAKGPLRMHAYALPGLPRTTPLRSCLARAP